MWRTKTWVVLIFYVRVSSFLNFRRRNQKKIKRGKNIFMGLNWCFPGLPSEKKKNLWNISNISVYNLYQTKWVVPHFVSKDMLWLIKKTNHLLHEVLASLCMTEGSASLHPGDLQAGVSCHAFCFLIACLLG